MNDTTRMVGGALGVAVLGTVLAGTYSSTIAPAVAGLPEPAAAAAADSIGAATALAAQAGPAGQPLLDAARGAFVAGMGDAVLVAAGCGPARRRAGPGLPARSGPRRPTQTMSPPKRRPAATIAG